MWWFLLFSWFIVQWCSPHYTICVCASMIWIEESKHWMVTKDNVPSKTIGFGRFRLFTELRAKAWMREWESRDTRDWLPPFIMCIISWAYFIALNLRKTIIHGASNCNESSIVTMDHHQLTRNKQNTQLFSCMIVYIGWCYTMNTEFGKVCALLRCVQRLHCSRWAKVREMERNC